MDIADAVKTLFENQQAIDISLADVSDGYHTFAELYHHRAVLFSVIVNEHKDAAWKSKRHHDGTMYANMFIVGIDTPEGQATYHYDIDPYWDMFECRELEYAPEWDGHTPDVAIARIARLGQEKCKIVRGTCNRCGALIHESANMRWKYLDGGFRTIERMPVNFCPNCGWEVEECDM